MNILIFLSIFIAAFSYSFAEELAFESRPNEEPILADDARGDDDISEDDEMSLADELQNARRVPFVGKDGEIKGRKIMAVKSRGVFEKLGLKKGDVIKGVKGTSVDSPQKAMELYQNLKHSEDGQVEIQRRKREFE